MSTSIVLNGSGTKGQDVSVVFACPKCGAELRARSTEDSDVRNATRHHALRTHSGLSVRALSLLADEAASCVRTNGRASA